MTTKAILVIGLILGMAQSSLASIDSSQRGTLAAKSIGDGGDCPYKSNAGRFADTTPKITQNQNSASGSSSSDKGIN